MPPYEIPPLPPQASLETLAVRKALIGASRALARLDGKIDAIPNTGILIDTLTLQEARASSEIENYVTTQDDVFQIGRRPIASLDPVQKEVARYREALRHGHAALGGPGGLLTNNVIVGMYRLLKQTDGGFRTTPGTRLRNDATGEVVYTPPQHPASISSHMNALETYINAPPEDGLDPLVRMAIIHHQFESIHPFSDGNGRLGRILNVLYLVQQDLLSSPVLYLSRHVNQTKADYYRLLQSVRDTGEWEDWLLYMIGGVDRIARETTDLVERLRTLMAEMKTRLRDTYPFYSQDLLNNLFRHPYTRIDYVMEEIGVSRPTATKYLNRLAEDGVLVRIERGRNVYFVNGPLVDLFAEGFGD